MNKLNFTSVKVALSSSSPLLISSVLQNVEFIDKNVMTSSDISAHSLELAKRSSRSLTIIREESQFSTSLVNTTDKH